MNAIDKVNLTDLRMAAEAHPEDFYKDKLLDLIEAIESDRKAESPIEWWVPLTGGRRALVRLPRHVAERDWEIMREVLSGWLDLAHDAMVVDEPDHPYQ